MMRALQAAACLLAAAGLLAADQKNTPKPAPPSRPPAARPANPPRAAGAPKAGVRQPGPPIVNPANPVTRLYRATPEERERALEKLPPAMQEQFRNQLRRFDSMAPEQQQAILRQGERYAALPREKQDAFRQSLQTLNKMDPERRRPIAMTLRRLETMPDAQRRALLESDELRTRFSPEELKIISDLSVVMLPPL